MKNRLLSTLLTLCMVLNIISVTTAHAASATTVPSGYTAIYTASDLDAVRNNLSGNYILMNDIDLSSRGAWNPISGQQSGKYGFSGIFDGNGYAILNMRITDDVAYKSGSTYYAGLFSQIDGATIKNIRMITGSITTNDLATLYVGGIAGTSTNSLITNCANSVSISYQYGTPSGNAVSTVWGQALRAGGIIGYASNISSTTTYIEKCANYGKILGVANSATMHIGGIVGQAWYSVNVKNCYNAADLSARTDYTGALVGGVVGEASSMSDPGCSFINCYNIGILSAESGDGPDQPGGVGGLISNNKSNSISNCYYLSNENLAIGVSANWKNIYTPILSTRAVSRSDMRNQSTYSGFEFNSVWVMGDSSYPYPILKWMEDSTTNPTLTRYRVTFDANGGYTNSVAMTVVVGKTYGELPIPTRTGYTFDGWYIKRYP